MPRGIICPVGVWSGKMTVSCPTSERLSPAGAGPEAVWWEQVMARVRPIYGTITVRTSPPKRCSAFSAELIGSASSGTVHMTTCDRSSTLRRANWIVIRSRMIRRPINMSFFADDLNPSPPRTVSG